MEEDASDSDAKYTELIIQFPSIYHKGLKEFLYKRIKGYSR